MQREITSGNALAETDVTTFHSGKVSKYPLLHRRRTNQDSLSSFFFLSFSDNITVLSFDIGKLIERERKLESKRERVATGMLMRITDAGKFYFL